MNGLFNVRKADISDIKIIQKLIKNLAEIREKTSGYDGHRGNVALLDF